MSKQTAASVRNEINRLMGDGTVSLGSEIPPMTR